MDNSIEIVDIGEAPKKLNIKTITNPYVYRPQKFSDTNRFGYDYDFWVSAADKVPKKLQNEYLNELIRANNLYIAGEELVKQRDFAGYHLMAEGACRGFANYQYYVYDNPNYLIPINAELYRKVNGQMIFPVDVRTFVEDPEYLGDTGIIIWPNNMVKLQEMNRYPFTTDVGVREVLMGGAVGIGKTQLAVVSCLYTLYLLSCYEDINSALFPFRSSQKPISMLLSSVNLSQMMSDTFESVLGYYDACPYFQKNTTRNTRKSNQIEMLSMDVNVEPVLAKRSKIVAYDLLWAFIDEVNQMEIIESSVKSKGDDGGASYYHQAEEIVSECLSRYESRFVMRADKPFPKIGAIYQASSANYIGDYLDTKFKNQEENPDNKVVCYKYMLWEAKDAGSYCGDTFTFLVGTNQIEGRVLDIESIEGVDYPEGAETIQIPIEHYDTFKKDPIKGQREFMGRPTSTSNKLFENQVTLLRCMNAYAEHIKKNTDIKRYLIENSLSISEARANKEVIEDMQEELTITEEFLAETDLHTGYILKPNVILARDGMITVNVNALPLDLDTPRFIHLDMSSTGDATGISCVKVSGTKTSIKGEQLPIYMVEFACSIKPSKETPITNTDVREFIQDLKHVYGLNIKKVTYDGSASSETIDVLRTCGISTGYLSVDRKMDEYEYMKDLIIQERVLLNNNIVLAKELYALIITKSASHTKVDHPAGSGNSKDIADSVCGALYSASQSREVKALRSSGNQNKKRRAINRRSLKRR